MLIYGEQGMGKSSYAIQVLKELTKAKGPEAWRRFMVFTPEEFILLSMQLSKDRQRAPAIIFDDAGVHFGADRWYDPKVQSAIQLMQVARTITQAMIFTSPAVGFVLKKVQKLEGMLIGKVAKADDRRHPYDRYIKLYRNSIAVWGKRYINEVIQDHFKIMLPDQDYDYYAPKREAYVDAAIASMRKLYKIE